MAGDETPERETRNQASAGRAGFDFVATVMAMAGLGWLGDLFLGTRPFGILGMFFLGFVIGLWNIWRSLNEKK